MCRAQIPDRHFKCIIVETGAIVEIEVMRERSKRFHRLVALLLGALLVALKLAKLPPLASA